MRIWHPIPPLCLDRQRLLGEHRELHAIWNILTQDRTGYRNHPEVKRWEGRLPELVRRHLDLLKEMERRGYNHASPVGLEDGGDLPTFLSRVYVPDWPNTWEPIEVMRSKLAEKQKEQ